jgi:hypothetical protein
VGADARISKFEGRRGEWGNSVGGWVLTFSVPLEKRELTVKPPLLKPCQTVSYRYEV